MSEPTPRLYREFAEWWPIFSAPEEYAEEATEYTRLILGASSGRARTVLELGSGGGNNALHMKASFDLTLVDRSPQMLDVSRALNPECEHVEGDMRRVRLGRTFDAVFVHDAIAYILTEGDLAAVFSTALEHSKPGGVALFVPDYVAETFEAATDHGGHDGPDRSIRYMEWTWDPDPTDSTHRMDLTYVFHEPDPSVPSGVAVQVEFDPHVCGLFPRATWLSLIEAAGFEVRAVPLTHDERPVGAEGFLAIRPR